MPLDLRGFMGEPEKWSGLYSAADQLEKRKLRADQLALQREGRRASAGTFLQNYLDPKDLLTGTAYDPMIIQGLETAMQQGSALAASGADAPMLMMALGPMVNKVTRYSTNAKSITKQVDDYIGKMKESGIIGYDFAKLKDEALRSAFYKTDPNTGQSALDPDTVDPSVNWVERTIQDSPEKITTTSGWDTFADKAKMKTELDNITDFDRFGNMDKHAVSLKYQEYMVPEKKGGKVTGFVPKYDKAVDGSNALMHDFVKPDGTVAKEQVRVLDKDVYDGLPKPLLDDIRGKLKKEISAYETATGEKLSMNHPKVQLAARALAYKELNRSQRNFGAIENTGIYDKPSAAQVRVNVGSTPEALALVEKEAEARARARTSIVKPGSRANAVEVMVRALRNDSDVLQGSTIEKDGRQVYDITPIFPGGGLSSGRGADFKYKGIFFDPGTRNFIVEKETKDRFGIASKKSEVIEEKDIRTFLHKIAQANGVGIDMVNTIIEKLGYGSDNGPTPAQDVENRLKNTPSWRDATINSIANPFSQQFK